MNRRARAPGPALLWLAGAFLLLGFPLVDWIRAGADSPLRRPSTPIDRTDDNAARQWLFLWEARGAVPPGATYTVLAPTPEEEMNLFMISLGLFSESRALPSSYYGVPAPDVGRQARYVLVYRRRPPREPLILRANCTGGAVYERAETSP